MIEVILKTENPKIYVDLGVIPVLGPSNFETRVLADGGILENDCEILTSGVLPDFEMIPQGYKSRKLYSQRRDVTDNDSGYPLSVDDFEVDRLNDATRVNKDGLIEVVSASVPRLDYSDGNCPALLVEPSRTNSVIYSEDFIDGIWIKENVTVSVIPNF